jgi:rhodanese-related sulfurtransferase
MSLTLAEMVGAARASAHEVSTADDSRALTGAARALVLDVREPGEFAAVHLPGAINVPRRLLELRADPSSPVDDERLSADQAQHVLVYCTKGPGARSLLAGQTLASMGYTDVEVGAGGLNAWSEAGLPVGGAQEQAVA